MAEHLALLPSEFSDLEPFAATWAGRSTDERHHRRQTAALAETRLFYESMKPRLDAVFDYLDRFALSALPTSAETLLHLSFGFAEAAASVEIFDAPGLGDMPYPHGIRVTTELREPGRL